MSIARKCNRCGICFDPGDSGTTSYVRLGMPYTQSPKDYRKGNVTTYLFKDEDGRTDERVDLCPRCSEMFIRFARGEDLPDKPPVYNDEEELTNDQIREFLAKVSDDELFASEHEKY